MRRRAARLLFFFFFFLFLYLLGSVQASLPQITPTHATVKFPASPEGSVHTSLHRQVNRLPGVCRRLRRRRITVLCNTEQYCLLQHGARPGQLCRCPKRSKCSHFFLKSL